MNEDTEMIINFINAYMVFKEDWVMMFAYKAPFLFNPFSDKKHKIWTKSYQKDLLAEKIEKFLAEENLVIKEMSKMEIVYYLMRYCNREDMYLSLKKNNLRESELRRL